MDNLENVFKKLFESGVSIYVLSGGVKNVIVNSLSHVSKYIKSIEAYDFIFNENGEFCDFLYPAHDLENKFQYVEIVKKELGINGDSILFVGNGVNDESVYKTGAKTLCINPDGAHYQDKVIWSNYIEKTSDLNDILQFIDK